ncbi:MAG: replicative DNA helicase [Hyphomicrobiales bacterium]|nr:replicative DNA helicase [Hyphomicrobiales bacterium]
MAERSLQTVEDEKSLPTYREVPYNIDAEQILLGAILTNNEAYNRVGDFLRAEHFYEPLHRRIFDAIMNFMERGLVANPVTLRSQFDRDEALSDIGGASYLAKIAGLASGVFNVKDYARIIYDLYISRNLIEIGNDIVDEAYKGSAERAASEQIEKAEGKLFTLASEGGVERAFVSLKDALKESLDRTNAAFKRQGDIHGIPTALRDLDKMLGGLQNSDLVILAARPSMGKTALALNIALSGAKFLHRDAERHKDDPEFRSGSVGIFSLEMSSEQLASRMLSVETGINANSIRRGKLGRSPQNDEFARLVQANKDLYALPIFIDDTPALSISAIRTRARRLKRKYNLSLLVIDYLQLIRGVSAQASSNRVQEISEITMGLKAIAKELDIPVLALSQLSRAVEQRDDKRPQLSDLRESGSIEQDADVVMFIYRESYYTERLKPDENSEKFAAWLEKMEQVNNVAEVIVSKHRNGPIGNVTLFFDKTTTRFGDLERQEYMEAAF